MVDEELDRVPEEFKDPRFDSLRHVLDILSAVDAEAALEEVCQKSQNHAFDHDKSPLLDTHFWCLGVVDSADFRHSTICKTNQDFALSKAQKCYIFLLRISA